MKLSLGRKKIAGADVGTNADVDRLEQLAGIEQPDEDAVEIEIETQERKSKRHNVFSRLAQRRKLVGDFNSYPHLLAMKPREKYIFRSDYYQVDGSVGCVLAFFHDDAAHDAFSPFWGIDRIPAGLDERVTTVVMEQVVRMDDKWVDSYTEQSQKLDNVSQAEQGEAGTISSRRKANKATDDLASTIAELQNGASYLSVHHRLLVKAPDLETLEDSLERIARLYVDRFGTLRAAPYIGEQRQELTGLLRRNKEKKGKGFYFTSTELAGSYSLVTNGLNDRSGVYVGTLAGEINSSAVIFDANDYDHHVVIADDTHSNYLDRQLVSNMWCSKLSQEALLANSKVVHLVLDGADLDKLGPKFTTLTKKIDLNSGDVNMFEMFGDPGDELTVFAAHIEKLKLMFEQLYSTDDGAVASIIRGELERTATDFYVDQGMWRHNAKEYIEELRVLDLDHSHVPRLQMFVSYLDTAHKALLNSAKNDPDQLKAYNVLRSIASNMLSTNGDLFNKHTAEAIDGLRTAPRVIYDFSKLMRRGKGVAMAQLVNIVGFAVGTLSEGDTLIIHGTEAIDERVKSYLVTQFEHLYSRGGRVVYSYNDVDKMLDDSDFNKFDAAQYTLLGWMRDKSVLEYERQLAQEIPPDLERLITRRGEGLVYLRRGHSNVVFHQDLPLGINPARQAKRRAVALAAAKAGVGTGDRDQSKQHGSPAVDQAAEQLKAQTDARVERERQAKLTIRSTGGARSATSGTSTTSATSAPGSASATARPKVLIRK